MNPRATTSVWVMLFFGLLATSGTARAQAAQNTLVAGVGVVQYDLIGVGNAVGMTLRATRALTNHLAVEGSSGTNAPPVTSVNPRRWTALSVPVRGVESRTAAAIDVA